MDESGRGESVVDGRVIDGRECDLVESDRCERAIDVRKW